MLAIACLLFGAVLLALALAERAVRRWPLTPALVYLIVGIAAGLGAQAWLPRWGRDLAWLQVASEAAVLISLFAVGLRLRMAPTWRLALLLAGPGMVVTVALASLAAAWLLELPWGAALVLAGILAPTDPVLASEVQVRSERDRDAVRVALSAEGGLNDGTALPAVMLGLGLLGAHPLLGSEGVPGWWWTDLLWPIGGGACIGAALGWGLGRVLCERMRRGDPLARDELIYIGGVALAYGSALASGTSTFIVTFVAAVCLLQPMRLDHGSGSEDPLAERLHAFGTSIERLVEAAAVLAVGIALSSRSPGWRAWLFALLLVAVVRPLSVWFVLRRGALTLHQRRLVGWFGIRGLGSLYYLALVLRHELPQDQAALLVDATLTAIALSILLHGVSSTPLMLGPQRHGH